MSKRKVYFFKIDPSRHYTSSQNALYGEQQFGLVDRRFLSTGGNA